MIAALHVPRAARVLRHAGTAVTLLALVGWLVLLRPQSLGGPAGYVLVSGTSMEPTLRDGDIVVTRRQDTYGRGNVVAYRVPQGEVGAGAVVIHRVIGGSARAGYRLKGDNREEPDLWRPRPPDIEGEQLLRIPAAGRVLAKLSAPGPLAGLTALLAFLGVGSRRRVR